MTGFSGILCNYCRLSPNATYVSVFGGLAACAACKLSIGHILPAHLASLVHWRNLRK